MKAKADLETPNAAFFGSLRPHRAESHNPNKRIPAAKVRNLCGGVSDMTLWRWLNDPELNFPKPIYIGRRRYWRENDVIEWLEAQGEVA